MVLRECVSASPAAERHTYAKQVPDDQQRRAVLYTQCPFASARQLSQGSLAISFTLRGLMHGDFMLNLPLCAFTLIQLADVCDIRVGPLAT